MTTKHFTAATLLALSASALTLAGCKKTDDSKLNYTKAIDSYYASRPACLWSDTKKFPLQKDTGDSSETMPYDALVDQGLLTRTTAQKKELLILSKQVTNYDLSDKGRGAWTADPQQPGYGNFCYGTRKVDTIDAATPTSDQPGATTTVSYKAKLSEVPGWATAAETQNAYPDLKARLAGPAVTSAVLTNTQNGWVVTTGPDGKGKTPVRAADGKIVE